MRELDVRAASLVRDKPAHWRLLLLANFLREDVEALWQEELSVVEFVSKFDAFRPAVDPLLELVEELEALFRSAVAACSSPAPFRAADDHLIESVDDWCSKLVNHYRQV